ncbi:MAG: LLM class flavin-dependent oxidoreductase [Actinomycetota bacterium]|nr:LLM class flavin-dependent oxidoreductase [Actinomycetota bacterium]
MFGLNIDPSADRLDLAFDLVAVAEAAGLDIVAVQDHPYHRRHLDTWTLLTVLATRTARVHVMPNVANLPLRGPQVLAKSAASLAYLTGGRIELGIGAGAQWDAIAAYGGPRRGPGDAVDALDEALDVIEALWDGDRRSATVEGRYYRLDGARPGPVPNQPIPIWIGGYGPRMLRLVGRRADGWTVSSSSAPPERILDMQRTVDEAAQEAGRDPAGVGRNYNLMGRLDPDADRHEGERLSGPTDHWVDVLCRYAEELRFDTFLFWPLDGDEVDQARRFADDVVPRVCERLGDQHPCVDGSEAARERPGRYL